MALVEIELKAYTLSPETEGDLTEVDGSRR